MRCIVCKKTCEEVELSEGILEDGMVMVCKVCAESEGIPVVKKPSSSQLQKADKRYTVRERMERISGSRDPTKISEEQVTVQGNLAKLRVPPKKEHHEDVLEKYHWTLNLARRRIKMTTSQLSEKIGIPAEDIRAIERGVLPENFHELFLKLEAFLGIKMLKNQDTKISFNRRNRDEEKEILQRVQQRIDEPEDEEQEKIDELELEMKKEEKHKTADKIARGEIDFSRREQLEEVTLNDLVDMKRRKEKLAAQKREQSQTESLIGDDLELDLDEL